MNESIELNVMLPHYAANQSRIAWIGHEVWDHLWPWSRHSFRRQPLLSALTVAAAAAMAAAWLLDAAGRIELPMTLVLWVGWSILEVLVRMQSKPYVKEGPWWGRAYRGANLMDMLCYVSFKNLLLGALLFLAGRAAAALGLLHWLAALDWVAR